MLVARCTHSALTHFLHPLCPHQKTIEKAAKVFLLCLGAVLAWFGYRAARGDYSYPAETNRSEGWREAEIDLFIGYAIPILRTPGASLSPSPLFGCMEFLSREFPNQLSLERSQTYSKNDRLTELLPAFNRFLAIPCLDFGWTTDHIVLLLFEKNNDGTFNLEFFDSKGYTLELNAHARQIKNDLDKLYNIQTFTDVRKRFQVIFDWHNCGAYITWYLEQRLRGKTVQEIRQLTPDIEAYRLGLAERMDPPCLI
jgi:hypothetical protein